MGMLIRRHRERHEADEARAEKPKRQRNRRKADKPAEPQAPAPEDNPYDGLTDEQVAEAYATNVGGEATERDAQVAELQALEAEPEDNPPGE